MQAHTNPSEYHCLTSSMYMQCVGGAQHRCCTCATLSLVYSHNIACSSTGLDTRCCALESLLRHAPKHLVESTQRLLGRRLLSDGGTLAANMLSTAGRPILVELEIVSRAVLCHASVCLLCACPESLQPMGLY